MKIYLDDTRKAPDGWILVPTYEAAIILLATGQVEELSLDHDLGTKRTGYDVLLWIEKRTYLGGFNPPNLYVHSANLGARRKMELAIEAIQKLSKG